jgi:hypothetical protein
LLTSGDIFAEVKHIPVNVADGEIFHAMVEMREVEKFTCVKE